MSSHFYPVSVKEIRKETDDCVSIAFDIPENLQETFKYLHGQHITLKTIINGEEVRRSYSLCNSPTENEWRIAVKKIDEGVFSAYASARLKQGDMLELMPPMGSFSHALDKTAEKKYVAFAAGSGITPIISIIKTTLSTEPKSVFTLLYGNRDRNSIIFKEEISGLKNKYTERLNLLFILSREKTEASINYGRIDKEKCEILFSKFTAIDADDFFICGPEEMIFTVKNYLVNHHVDEKKIHFELFTTENNKAKAGKPMIKKEENMKSKVSVKLDGITFDFDLGFTGESILDAALQQGADLPYSCKGGVCCTCKAKLIEGQVEMDMQYGLEPEEIAAGYILTCQSHPVSEKVVIDFDVK